MVASVNGAGPENNAFAADEANDSGAGWTGGSRKDNALARLGPKQQKDFNRDTTPSPKDKRSPVLRKEWHSVTTDFSSFVPEWRAAQLARDYVDATSERMASSMGTAGVGVQLSDYLRSGTDIHDGWAMRLWSWEPRKSLRQALVAHHIPTVGCFTRYGNLA